MSEFNFFLPIAKVDKEKRTVSGYASTPTKDSDGEVITLEAVRNALPDYMTYGNIREMHALKAVGVAKEANLDTKGLYLTAKIVDDSAWKKCLEGVYKGFSIGGKKLEKEGDTITAIELHEISVVDRPANPDCRMALAKSAKDLGDAEGYLLKAKEKGKKSAEQKALVKMAKIVESLALAKTNPPAAHDGFSLPAKTAAATNPSPRDDSTQNNKAEGGEVCKDHGVKNCDKCTVQKDADKPYGDVEYADPGYQGDKKKRYPVDTEDHIRAAWNYINKPKNAAKYSPENAAKVKAKIVSAWKAKIDKEGPPSAKEPSSKKEAKKLAKQRIEQALTLGGNVAIEPIIQATTGEDFLNLPKREKVSEKLDKGMSVAGSLSYCFDSLRDAQRSLMMEAKREGGDMKDKDLAKRVGAIAKQLAEIISQKASHEGEESLDLSDANDQYLVTILGEEFAMDKTTGGDPLATAILDLVKRSAEPSHEKRLEMAKEDVKKARKAMKECRKAIEEAHAMHKAAYLSKAKKADKKPKEDDDDDDGFDHAGAMEKLNKAYTDLDKARTFGKAAVGNIEKAESVPSRAGQRGQEAGDGNSNYQVPAGVKDLSPSDLATAGPGGDEKGSTPSQYPLDGSVYSGKADNNLDLRKYAKNGQVSAEVAALLINQARQEAELETLRRVPNNNGRRPYAFDLTKVNAGGAAPKDLNKALFDGVDATAFNSGDELAHTQASARMIGNFLTSGHFGKSVLDPAFKGAAGSAR